MNRYTVTVWGYYAYRVTTSFGFWVPVGTLYLLRSGFGLDVVGLVNAVLVFAIVATEIPAGYLADVLGRRTSLALGSTITTVVMGTYGFVTSGDGYVMLYGLWGVGFACQSAIGEAWLYDLLDAEADEAAFAAINGRGETAELATGALTALGAVGLYSIDPVLPFLANALLAASGIPILALLPATRSAGHQRLGVQDVLSVLRIQLGRPEIRWFILFSAVFNILFSLTRWLEQPALDAVGLSIAGLGVVYAAFRFVSAIATSTAGSIQHRLGPRGFFLVLVPLIGLSYSLIAVVPTLVVPVLFVRRGLDRVAGPIRNQYVNDRVSSYGRATVLSGVSMALHLASGVGNVVAGPLAEAVGPLTFMPIAGFIVAVSGGMIWVVFDPVRSNGSGTASNRSRMTYAD